jgi:hypothetical protein
MIKVFGQIGEDLCKLEEARNILNFDTWIILVESQRVQSYDQLVRMASLDKYKDREYLEVVLLPVVEGG